MRKYSLLIPSGYTLVDLEEPTKDAAARIASTVVLGLPTEGRRKAKALVEQTLSSSFIAMAAQGSFAVLISVAPLAEQALRPMIVFSRFRPESGGDPLDAIVGMAASQAGATLFEFGNLVGLRVERTDDVSIPQGQLDGRLPAELVELADAGPGGRSRMVATAGNRLARRVDYFFGTPDDDDSWVSVQAGVQVAGDVVGEAFADTFVELFDLVIKTFHWESRDE